MENLAPAPSHATRQSLLVRLKDWEDQAGWQEFFDTYWRLIYGVATRAGLSDAEAQDVVQETLVAVAKKMSGFKYDPSLGSFKGWLLLNVRSRIVEHWRRNRSERERLEANAYPPGDGDGPRTNLLERQAAPDVMESTWDEEWTRNLLTTAVERVKAKVSARQYLIFDMFALKQIPLSEVTRALGINAAQVYLAKHRIGRLVRKEVETLRRKLGE